MKLHMALAVESHLLTEPTRFVVGEDTRGFRRQKSATRGGQLLVAYMQAPGLVGDLGAGQPSL